MIKYLLSTLLILASARTCGGQVQVGGTLNVTPAAIQVTFSPASIVPGASSTLTANEIMNDNSLGVVRTAQCQWTSATPSVATISPVIGYGPSPTVVGVAAGTSVITCTDGTLSGTATITVVPVPDITNPVCGTPPCVLPQGTNGSVYSPFTFTQSGCTGTNTWTVTVGTINTGLALSTAGVISGTPTVTATSTFTVQDSCSSPVAMASVQVSITVIAAGTCGPPNFNCSSQSTAVAVTPPLPFLGSSPAGTTGYAYSISTDFFYPFGGVGNCYSRLTDASTKSGAAWGASWSGGASNNMTDTSGAFRAATDGNNLLFYHTHRDVNGCLIRDSPMADSTLGGSSGGGFTFSRTTAARAYKVSGKTGDGLKTRLYQLDLAYTGGLVVVTPTLIYDYSNNPGMDGTLTATAGAGNLNVDSADGIFSTSLNFLPGGQDHAHWVLAWRKSDGAGTTYYTGAPQDIITPFIPSSASSGSGLETLVGTGFTFAVGDSICVQGMTPSTLNVCGLAQSPTNSTTVTLPNAATATGTNMGTFGLTENQWSGNIWGWCIGNCSQHGSNPAPLALNSTCLLDGSFGIHNNQGFHSGNYSDVVGHCSAAANNFTSWQFGVNHVTTCNSSLYDCGGHETLGYHKLRGNNVNWTIRDESDLSIFTTYATGSVLGMDHHGSTNWTGTAADVNPSVWETQPTTSAQSCTVSQPYACELVAFRLDGTIARFGPTFHILDPRGDLGPILALDQDGGCIVMQTNWNQTFGTQTNGAFRRDLVGVCGLK